MLRIDSRLELPRRLGRPVVTIGTFDGVHKGHQRVLSGLCAWARELGTRSLVVTFDRSPKTVTRGERAPFITSLEHRLVLFERLGVDACAVLRFDRALSEMSAFDFAVRVLYGRFRARGILLGFNGRFGRNGEGDAALLQRLAGEGLFRVRCERSPVRVGGRVVSSSAIRTAIESGRLREAGRMLGRPVALLGTVVRGLGRGTVLGFPTANLDLHHEVIPPSGVYATEARLGRVWRPALTSIGRQPTFRHPPRKDVVEVFIPGIRRALYGLDVEVRFARKLREQVRFGSAEELIGQMRRDVEALKRYVKESDDGG